MKYNKVLLAIFFIATAPYKAQAEYLDLNPGNEQVISWASEEGKKRLSSANYKQDFFSLAHNFEAQINPLYCGAASSVIILNSLKLGKEEIPSQADLQIITPEEYGAKVIEYRRFSQQTVFNKITEQAKKKSVIELQEKNKQGEYDPGLTLAQLKEVLDAYGLHITLFYANDLKIGKEEFRKILIQSLNQTDNFLLANFYGKNLGLASSGHISPIAAFDQETDSILILDVAGHKNPWYWVDIDAFYLSMNTRDGNEHRGYLLVEN